MEMMIMKQIDKNSKTFEEIKHMDENATEFWYARELMPVLQYSNWQNFERIINKAKISCQNSDISILDHFIDVSKMVQIGSGAYREQTDYKLTRYACYLIAQNGDSRKKLLLQHKHILQFKLENKKLVKKNIVYLRKMKKDFIKEI